MANIRPQEIINGASFETEQAAWKAIGELTAKFVELLTKLDDDTALDESDYAATLTPTNQITES